MGNFCEQVLKSLGSYTRVFTAFQQGKPSPLIYLKPEKGALFGRNLACIGHYICREYAPRKITDVCQPNNNSASRRNFFRMCIKLAKAMNN